MSILQSATTAMLLEKIQSEMWDIKEVPILSGSSCTQKEYSLYETTPFVCFHASGGWANGTYWVGASFSDMAVSINDEHRLLEEDFESDHWEECLFKAREWLLANAKKAVDVWAKKYEGE